MGDSIAFMPNGEGLISFGIWDKALKYWDIGRPSSGAAVGAERKETNLSFVGHTVCPSLSCSSLVLLIFKFFLSSHRLLFTRFPSHQMVNGSHPALLTVLSASGILAPASSSAFCEHMKRTFRQFILAL
jgi:hypothetical protein